MRMQQKFEDIRQKIERTTGVIGLPKDVNRMSYEQYVRARLAAKRLIK